MGFFKNVIFPFTLIISGCVYEPKQVHTRNEESHTPIVTSSKNLVVTCQSSAAKIGMDILKSGGNAADAFVAATVAEYVTAPGYTSLSGPLYVLYYDSKTGKASYLNAGLSTVNNPAGQWSDKDKRPGTAYVIGGAGRGLEALFKRFGSTKKTFKDLITPSIALAKNGFVIDRSFSGTIRGRLSALGGSANWIAQYTKNGQPLQNGETLVQTQLAETLNQYGEKGADYLFKGKYAKKLVNFIRAQGGKLNLRDLSDYQVQWCDPLETVYRGLNILTSSCHSYGGLELFLDLKVIENFDFLKRPHFSEDLDVFTKVLRTYIFSKRAIFPYMSFVNREDDPKKLREIVDGSLPKKIWADVIDDSKKFPIVQDVGTHSCSPVIIDQDGNIAVGTHTINSLQWGDFGFIVDGVSLNTAHAVALDAPPGVRAIDGLNPVLVFKNNKPMIAAAFFSSGLHGASFQTLINLIDYKLNPQLAISFPRFGPPTSYKPVQLVIDKRIPTAWIVELKKQGILVTQPEGFIDTGMSMVVSIDLMTGLRSGSPTDLLRNATVIGD